MVLSSNMKYNGHKIVCYMYFSNVSIKYKAVIENGACYFENQGSRPVIDELIYCSKPPKQGNIPDQNDALFTHT